MSTPDSVASGLVRGAPSIPRLWYRRRWFVLPVGSVVTLLLVVVLAFNLSPWPGALLIRAVFERGASNVHAEMVKHTPSGISSITGQQYRPGDDDAYLDVYFPDSVSRSDTTLPTVVWIHGGAWISGHKADAAPYYMLIAAAGYTVVALDYSVGPEHQYPRPVMQINAALSFIQAQAGAFHVDVSRIVIAGDSAGAQLTSQIAAMTTNPAYAGEVGLTPAITPSQLRGVVLFCGIYDMDAFRGNDPQDLAQDQSFMTRLLLWGTDTTLWAYTGTRHGSETALAQMSTIDGVTSAFPPTFISGGNADPLTAQQSRALASRLQALGVPVTARFFPDDHVPPLNHEYQFHLDQADGQQTLTDLLGFLGMITSPPV